MDAKTYNLMRLHLEVFELEKKIVTLSQKYLDESIFRRWKTRGALETAHAERKELLKEMEAEEKENEETYER